MRLSSKPIVTIVKKQHLQHYQNQKNQTTNSVRVTRIKSCTSNSIKDINNVEHAHISSGNSDILPRDYMSINVDRPLTSATTTPFHSSSPIIGTQLQSIAPSLVEENQNIQRIQPSVSFTYSAKITPLNNNNSTNTVFHLTQSPKNSNINSKSFSYNLRPIYTIGKEHNIQNKRRNKLCQNQTCIRNLVLILILLVLIAVAIITPVVILLSKTTTTALTMSTTAFTSNTETSITTSTDTSTTSSSTTSSSSSSSTTSSITTESTTTPVATVTITSNICTANWSGIEMVANCIGCITFTSYYRYVRNYTAIGTSSLIVFGLRRQTGYFAFDDVSVKSFAAPNVEILVNGGFETGDLTGWSYCNQNNGTNSGGVEANSTHFTYLGFTYYANSGSYYYIGGSLTSNDYISQTFPTIIGEQYTIVIYYMNGGNGSLTSADLFLGV